MSSGILTLCPTCEVLMQDAFRVTKISIKTETPKHTTCDRCRKKYHSTLLDQYTVTARKR